MGLLDSLLEVYPSVEARLQPSARIFHTSSLKFGIAKSQDGQANDLNTCKKPVLRDLLLNAECEPGTEAHSKFIVKKRFSYWNWTKLLVFNRKDTRYHLSLFQICKRLFSAARRSFQPST